MHFFLINLISESNVRQIIYDIESENLRIKTENSAVMATLNQERERIKAYESKIIRYETSLDALNRKIRDKDEYIMKIERELSDKQTILERKDHEKEKQRRKFNSKIAEENDKKNRELEMKLNDQKRKMEDKMRNKEEKLRMVTEIINSEDVTLRNEPIPVSNLIHRFNSNTENVQPPGSERKPRPRVSKSLIILCLKKLNLFFYNLRLFRFQILVIVDRNLLVTKDGWNIRHRTQFHLVPFYNHITRQQNL